MENFYELLDLSSSDTREAIENELKKLNKTYRQRANLKDPKIRNEATDRINLIARAMVKFRSDEERVAYDQELDEYQKQAQLQEPLIDIDFYTFLELPIDSSTEQIQARLNEIQNRLDSQADLDEKTIREKQILRDAQEILLDPDRREKYTKQIVTKREFEHKRERDKPTPLIISSTEVSSWISLEDALVNNPESGLSLLQDGEIEAWLRWSLGQKQRANWVQEISNRSLSSDVPFMEFEELLRLINGNRPLVIYSRGEKYGSEAAPVINQISDIPDLADKHWRLFVQQINHILDWIAQYGDTEILDKLNMHPKSEIPDIQLERLLVTIDPQIPQPNIKIEGITGNKIDFGTLSKWETAEIEINLIQVGRGYLYGSISAKESWIKLSQNTFSGPKTKILVSLDKGNLAGGTNSSGTLVLNPLDGRIPSIEIQVAVEQRTAWQSVKNIFKKG